MAKRKSIINLLGTPRTHKLGTGRKSPMHKTSGPLSRAVRIPKGKGRLHDCPGPVSVLAELTIAVFSLILNTNIFPLFAGERKGTYFPLVPCGGCHAGTD